MDATLCNVIYVDSAIQEDRVFHARSANGTQRQQLTDQIETPVPAWESKTLEENICLLADVFGDVHLCGTGSVCMAKLFNLQDESMMGLKPTIVLIGTPHDERIPIDEQSRSPSPHSAPQNEAGSVPATPPTDEVYGLRLLRRIVSEAHLRNLSKLIVPVSVISFPESETEIAAAPLAAPSTQTDNGDTSSAQQFQMQRALNRSLLKGCLKLGATDVLFSPIQPQSITSLEIRAYWAHKSAARDQQALLELRRGRKRSWVGITDNRPFAYLRETMVASLMRRICQMEEGDELPVDAVRISVTPRRKQIVASSIGNWHFSAHDFDDDELIEASALMFKHALSMPELAEWRIPTDELICFLVACRAAYNSFVPYHNFRHVVDVLQATFNFLVNIGALPPYPASLAHTSSSPKKSPPSAQKSPMASLIRPFEALTLLITAIGHDVGHPGVNNGFLIVLNTPLAQLYNDRSVLESFHCAAYSQILRRYWPSAFNDSKMRNLMTSSILATDMGLHFDYMKKLGNTQEKLAENNTTDGWNGRMFEDQTALACALLIKCADISNVARRHDAALQWMHILSDEFSRQALMEGQLSIKSSLVSQPKKDNISLFRAQLGFMNMFAIPLFQGIASIMPAMQYCVDELEINKAMFERGIIEETAKEESEQQGNLPGAFSPRSMSIAVPTGTSEAAAPKQAIEQQQQSSPTAPTNGVVNGTYAPHDSNASRANGHIDNGDAISPKGMPLLGEMYQAPNGTAGNYDAVAEFAASDPFGINDGRPLASSKQRVSEATDGSNSLPGGGDWASQATSATTGKMPLSPSTQGTSIISRDSMERPSSVPVVSVGNIPAVSDMTKSPSDALITTQLSREDESSLSSGGHSGDNNGTQKSHHNLKKKSSRFRMNAFTFFRRHLSPSPPLPTSTNGNGDHAAAHDSCR
ncbi:3',5'-cyclic-nucleotide phosphodiesterase [Sporothrix eucalyptigena]|uniref:Phosphodiesterase n=1 Tax=Sporothrix eucalyptigena TaxID=1812306 RepID=A0ABP0BFL8_9PEZI